MNPPLYLLKIKLVEIEPEIWRRFVVPANITLDRLHDVIQIVMGWTDSHLHQFTIGKNRYTQYPESKEDGLECGMYQFGDLVKRKGRTIIYEYDFGDCWEHELTLEENHYFDEKLYSNIECLDGARACPPEDVGGTSGFFEFCSVLKNPYDEDYKRLMEWSGGDYDSEKFDTYTVNEELSKFIRWSRNRYKTWKPDPQTSY